MSVFPLTFTVTLCIIMFFAVTAADVKSCIHPVHKCESNSDCCSNKCSRIRTFWKVPLCEYYMFNYNCLSVTKI